MQNQKLGDDRYTVERSMVYNRYKAMNTDGTVVLKCKQKNRRRKHEFLLTDDDGRAVGEIKEDSVFNIIKEYTITDTNTGKDVAILGQEPALFSNKWWIKNADTNDIFAKIRTRNKLSTVLQSQNKLSTIFRLAETFPQDYEITTDNGQHIGSINGKLSMKTRYEIFIENLQSVPKDIVVASIMVVDAIESGC